MILGKTPKRTGFRSPVSQSEMRSKADVATGRPLPGAGVRLVPRRSPVLFGVLPKAVSFWSDFRFLFLFIPPFLALYFSANLQKRGGGSLPVLPGLLA